jgi:hypothetical protein
MNQG